jgi:hypothetical protein
MNLRIHESRLMARCHRNPITSVYARTVERTPNPTITILKTRTAIKPYLRIANDLLRTLSVGGGTQPQIPNSPNIQLGTEKQKRRLLK